MSFEKATAFLGGAPKRRVLGDAFEQSGLLTGIRFIRVQLAGRTRYSRIVHQIPGHVLVIERFFGFYVKFHHMDDHRRRIVLVNAPDVSIAARISCGIECHNTFSVPGSQELTILR